MRVDCSYMLSTWAADPEDEHRLLTRTMLALFRFPILPADRLIGALQNPPFDIQAKLAQHDVLTDPSDLWNVLDNEMRPSVPYVVTLALDPWETITGPLVRTRILRLGQAQKPALRDRARARCETHRPGTHRRRRAQRPGQDPAIRCRGGDQGNRLYGNNR